MYSLYCARQNNFCFPEAISMLRAFSDCGIAAAVPPFNHPMLPAPPPASNLFELSSATLRTVAW